MVDQIIQRLGMKQRPPVRGDITALCKVLGLPGRDGRRGGSGLERTDGVILDIRSSGSLEIRAYRATRAEQRGQDRQGNQSARLTARGH